MTRLKDVLPIHLAVSLAWLPLLWCTPALAGCNIASSGMAFGSYDPLRTSPLDGAADITVRCDAPTAYSISLGTGTGSYAARQMVGGAAKLVYNLHVDVQRSTIWGDASASSAVVSGVVTMGGASVHHAVYGRIPAMQNLPAGTYADSIAILVSY